MTYCITHILDPKREYAMRGKSWEEVKRFFRPDDPRQRKEWENIYSVDDLRSFLQETIYGSGNIVPFMILEIRETELQ